MKSHNAIFTVLILSIITVFLIVGLSSCKSKPKEDAIPAGFHLATAVDTLTLNKDNPGLVRVGDYIVTGIPSKKDIEKITSRIIVVPPVDSVSRKPESGLDSVFYYLDKELDANTYDSVHYWCMKLQAYNKKIHSK